MKTAVGAPAPRPSDEDMLDAIAQMTLRDVAYLRMVLLRLLISRIAKAAGL